MTPVRTARSPKPIEIVEVVQTTYPSGEVRSRVHLRDDDGERAIVEGPSDSPRIREWWGRARAQRVPIDTPIRARVVRDPPPKPRTDNRPVATLWKWVPQTRKWVAAGRVTAAEARSWKAKRKLNPRLPYWVSKEPPIAAPDAARRR